MAFQIFNPLSLITSWIILSFQIYVCPRCWPRRTVQIKAKVNFQGPNLGWKLAILLSTQYKTLGHHKHFIHHNNSTKFFIEIFMILVNNWLKVSWKIQIMVRVTCYDTVDYHEVYPPNSLIPPLLELSLAWNPYTPPPGLVPAILATTYVPSYVCK